MEKPKLVKKVPKPADPPKPTPKPKQAAKLSKPAPVEPVPSLPPSTPAATESADPTGPILRTSLSQEEIATVKALCMPLWLQGRGLNGIEFDELCARHSIAKPDLNRILSNLLSHAHLPREMTFRIEKAYYLDAPTWDGEQHVFLRRLEKTLKIHWRIVQSWIFHAGFVPKRIRKQCTEDGFEATPERLAAVGEAYLETLRADRPADIGLHKHLADKLGITRHQAHLLLFQWRGEFTKNRFPPVRRRAEERTDKSDACGSPTDDAAA
jgi:hypothetical protein